MPLNSPPVERTINLLHYFGWQGGTIHQLAEETGVSVNTLLYDQPHECGINSKYSHGACANETCNLAMRLELAKKVQGNREYWIGVATACVDHSGCNHAKAEA